MGVMGGVVVHIGHRSAEQVGYDLAWETRLGPGLGSAHARRVVEAIQIATGMQPCLTITDTVLQRTVQHRLPMSEKG
jgi:hypothetical protein